MLAFLFFSLSVEESNADLKRPFFTDVRERLHGWRYFADTQATRDEISLIPDAPNQIGILAADVTFPAADINGSYVLKFSNPTPKMGFGLWFIDANVFFEELYGGPSKFKGVALLGSFFDDSKTISLSLLERDSNERITEEKLKGYTDYSLNLTENSTIRINLTFTNKSIGLYVSNDGSVDNLTFVKNYTLKNNISEHSMLLSAANTEKSGKISVEEIDFCMTISFVKEYMQRRLEKAEIKSGINSTDTKFKNKKYNRTNIELAKLTNNIPTAQTIDDFFNVLDEVNNVTADVAKFKDLNELVRTSMLPAFTKLQRRTMKVYDRLTNLTKVWSSALAYSHEILSDFNNTISHNSQKFNKTIDILGKDLFVQADQDSQGIKMPTTRRQQAVMIISFIEIVALILYIIITSMKK